MGDLEGDDAFDRVLDRLVEMTKKVSQDEGALIEARMSATNARNAQTILERQVKALQQDQKEALPQLAELYAAAQACLPYIEDVISDGMRETRDRLKKALDEARRHCDEIPF